MKLKPCQVTPQLIAEEMDIPMGRLFSIASDTSPFYLPTRKKLIAGKLRELDVPKKWFKSALRKLHQLLQKCHLFHSSAYGGVKRRSCFKAAQKHLGHTAVATRDVSDCFPSITTAELAKRLLKLGFQRRTAYLLSRLLTHNNRVSQGSPVSNDALNLFLYDLDEEVSRACGSDAGYTRSADDHVVSGNDVDKIVAISQLIENGIVEHGLRVNETKRAKNGLVISPNRQLVHSIVVNNPHGTRINPEYTAAYTELGHKYIRAARCVSAESLEGVARLRRKLAGCISYGTQAQFSASRHLRRLLRTGDRIVQRCMEERGVTRSNKWWVSNRKRDRAKEYATQWRAIESRSR